MQNVYVLPPGQGRAVGVDVVEFMPVGSDALFALFGSMGDVVCSSLNPLRAHRLESNHLLGVNGVTIIMFRFLLSVV